LLSLLGTIFYRQRYAGLGSSPQVPNTSTGSVLFPETGMRLGGVFLDYWNKNGGLRQQGYPISDEFIEHSFTDGKEYKVQYFERAVFEDHDGTVLLSLLGVFQYDRRYVPVKPLPAPVPQPEPNAQGVVNVTVHHIGMDRPLIIVLPPSYKKGTPVPLVLVLHGGNGNGQDFYDTTPDIPETAKRNGFIAVYLTGLPLAGSKDPKNAVWEDAINDAYVPYVMDYMQANYSIDTRRIYMAGFSGGAKLTYRLASDPIASKRIAAIGTAAGDMGTHIPPTSLTSPLYVIDPLKLGGMPMSALLVQGGKDDKLPIDGSKNEEGGYKLDFKGKVDLWVKFIGGTPVAAPTLTGIPQRATVAKYANAQTGNAVVTVIDPVLAHKWPEWPLMSTLWEFFKSVPTR